MAINGNTKIVGIIGSPVTHTLSPVMHNAAFAKLGLNWAYLPFEVNAANLGKAIMGLKALGVIGLNVTIPHKESAMEFIDEFDEDASSVGAVNTIAAKKEKLIGYNTDTYGFKTALLKEGRFNPSGKKAVIVGGGGVSKAIAVGLASLGVAKITVFDIVKSKAQILAEKIKRDFQITANYFEAGETTSMFWAVREADILINATPLGMRIGDKPPVAPRSLHEGLFVFDAVYRDTPLIKLAKKKNLKHSNGLAMLLYQASKSFEIWTGKKAPVDIMRKALLGNRKK